MAALTLTLKLFPSVDEEAQCARLAPPRAVAESGRRPAVVIDTDTANEIDDQFALAWALLSADRLDLQATFAAPYSFEYRRREVLRARFARDQPALAGAEDREMLRLHAHKLAFWERHGWAPETLELPAFCTPEVGMQRCLQEAQKVYELLGLPHEGRVFAGSTRYLQTGAEPEASPATRRLIELAAVAARTDEPLYVLAIGCLTNIANALLLEPELVRHIVVVWTAGYPSHAPHVNRAFNLEQDRLAGQLVFDSGVPLVYLPGYHVGAQLRLSLPEIEAYVRDCGAIGGYLHHLFTHNPLWPLVGIDSFRAHSWVIWDLINVAWMLQPAWVPSELVRAPRIGADLRWHHGAGRHWMREAHAVQRDAIFGDFFDRLATAR